MKLGKLARKRNFIFKPPMEITQILTKMEYPKYVVKSPKDRFSIVVIGNDMRDWCTAQFGENGWYCYRDTIWFSSEKQLTAFLLRWAE